MRIALVAAGLLGVLALGASEAQAGWPWHCRNCIGYGYGPGPSSPGCYGPSLAGPYGAAPYCIDTLVGPQPVSGIGAPGYCPPGMRNGGAAAVPQWHRYNRSPRDFFFADP